MNRILIFLSLFFMMNCSSNADTVEIKEWKEQASRVTIIRDNWGIPHVYGKTDADAVFGLMYAQCEESFERVERNYLQILGRISETEGSSYLYQDLQMKILYDTIAAKADYEKAPAWLQKLLLAFADGINYYLYTHPEVKPLLLKHFEPWFPLLFTDGAYISTNTGGIHVKDMQELYGKNKWLPELAQNDIINSIATGSNAFAIGPSKTASGKTILYLNPHVSFYFRTEVHMVSEEGLNAYGAATWGQFFIFQGFNPDCGWMHTSSEADAADVYEEKIVQKEKKSFYEYNGILKPVIEKKLLIAHKINAGLVADSLLFYATHHGPILGSRNGKWLSLKERNRSINGLIQSWQRMKARSLADFEKSMQLKANTSTNTMYADNRGNIAYWHGNFIPRRDTAYNWNMPVDGATSATEWKGIHELHEIIHIKNPQQGYIQNCNSTPLSGSGFHTVIKMYPDYMAREGENFRSLRAIQLLNGENKFTLDKISELGYDRYLSLFDSLLPSIIIAYETLALSDPLYSYLKEPVMYLKTWDRKSSVSSVATTIAIFWTYQLLSDAKLTADESTRDHIDYVGSVVRQTTSKQKLEVLQNIIAGLQKLYGIWKIPWGDINRYQRTKTSTSVFNDREPSLPVGLAPAFFGSLPSFETIWGDTKQYGVAGNSFTAVVEFGEKVKARSIVMGGQFFDPNSKHFIDQAAMCIDGKFKDVSFYKEDVQKNAVKTYHPGNN